MELKNLFFQRGAKFSPPLVLKGLSSVLIFSQAGIYGVVLCGIRNLRVWFGPLPTWICYLHVQFTQILIFEFVLFMVFYITLTRFLFICIWRCMREMNDDLIAGMLSRDAFLNRLSVAWYFSPHRLAFSGMF